MRSDDGSPPFSVLLQDLYLHSLWSGESLPLQLLSIPKGFFEALAEARISD